MHNRINAREAATATTRINPHGNTNLTGVATTMIMLIIETGTMEIMVVHGEIAMIIVATVIMTTGGTTNIGDMTEIIEVDHGSEYFTAGIGINKPFQVTGEITSESAGMRSYLALFNNR